MLRFLLSAVAFLAAGALDGGAPSRLAGTADGGHDAGLDRGHDAGLDGGHDAGLPVIRWEYYDGGERFDGGETDLLELSVGASLELKLDQHAIDLLCDDPLVRVDILVTTFVFTGVSPGFTHCGFWYQPGMPPARYIGVEVLPAYAPPADPSPE